MRPRPSANVGRPRGELFPRGAAVRALEEAALGPLPLAVLPRALPRGPQGGVDDVRIRRVERHGRGARVLVLVKDHRPRPAAVRRPEDAALGVRAVRVAEDRGVNALRVTRVDGEARDLLGVAKAEMRPRFPRVRRLVDAVADGEVGPLQALAAPDVERVGARRGDGEGADRARGLVVEDRRPHASRVRRLPDPAVVRGGVEDVRVAGDAACRDGAPAAKRADHSPAHLREQRLGKRLRGRGAGEKKKRGKRREQGSTASKRVHGLLRLDSRV